MKLKHLPLLAAILAAPALSAQTTLDVRGTVYEVDTLYHAKVGPGTTQTHLHLKGPNALHVFYLTVDISTPGVSIRAVSATDKVAGAARTSQMAEDHSKPGLTYFAGSNGDFYWTSGSASNGSSQIGTATYSCVADGEVIKSSNAGYQFTVDDQGIPYVSRLNFYTGTATLGEKVTLFKGINVGSPDNGITIYTPRYWGSANQQEYNGSCRQVTARLVEGDKFLAGHKYRMVITSEPTDNGDTTVPDDGFVIHARGNSTSGCNTGAVDFVGSLHTGDIVEFDNVILTAEGKRIYPMATVSGNPKNVGGGETLDTEGERGDASARHPRTGIGYSQDGKKIIMMVIDGRSQISAGVQTSMLADVMRFAGAWEAVNLDGGGSSTLYVEKLGQRNHGSDGHERAVGNAIFAVLEAPDDDTVAEIQFVDWRRTVPYMSTYTPTVYAYNKYGRMIDIDFKDYTLSCDPELGTISADGRSFTASGSGMHALTARAGDAEAKIVITVSQGSSVAPRYPAVLVDNTRDYRLELLTDADGEMFPIDPSVLKWSSDNAEVATVDETGTVHGVANGTANISGVSDFANATVAVTVEVPAEKVLPAVQPLAENWSLAPTGMNSATIAPLENGIVLDYNIKTTRSAKLIAKAEKPVYSLPKEIRLRIRPGEAKIKSLTINLRANNEQRSVAISAKDLALEPDKENTVVFPIAETFDTNDIGIYPIELTSISISPGDAAKKDIHLEIPGIEAVYGDDDQAVETITGDAEDSNAPAVLYNLQGQPVPAGNAAPGLYIEQRGNNATKTIRH